MLDHQWLVYALHHQDEGSPYRYVGYTTVGMMRTFAGRHMDRAIGGHHYPVYVWMRSIGEENVGFSILEFCPEGDLEFIFSREIYWIAYYRELQGSLLDKKTENYLTNIADGGGGNIGYIATEEHRRKLSEVHLGKKKSAEHAINIGLASKGRVHSEEARQRNREAQSGSKNPNFGKVWSEETNRKRSESLKGHSVTDEQRQKMSYKAHLRHHVNKQKTKVDCKWCNGEVFEG